MTTQYLFGVGVACCSHHSPGAVISQNRIHPKGKGKKFKTFSLFPPVKIFLTGYYYENLFSSVVLNCKFMTH
jgi:hypothetical protein